MNLRIPEGLDNGHMKVVKFWALSTADFTPQEIPLELIYVRVWVDYMAGGFKRMKNRTLDLPACSGVPQPAASPSGQPNLHTYIYKYTYVYMNPYSFTYAPPPTQTQTFDMWR